jgi:anti-sigma factor RsiW
MSDCRDLEPMLAPYVEGDVDPKVRAAVDAHLRECPPCRDRVSGERAARDVLVARREGLKSCASVLLRERCAAHRAKTAAPIGAVAGATAPTPRRRAWLPLSIAATLLLGAGGILFFGLNQGVEVLAAQLVLDHVKCFQFPPDEPAAPPDPVILAREWSAARGWPVKIPASTVDHDLELLSIRRCASTEGITAHMMYRWRGAPLSVYVLNSAATRTGNIEHFVEKIGQEAVVWSHAGRTYAIVARAPASEMDPIIKYVKINAY